MLKKYVRSGIAGAILLFVVTGCSTGESDSLSPEELFAQDIKVAGEQATSDFEKDVLADGKIEQAEYAEAWQRYISCMQENGFPNTTLVGPDADGLYSEQTTSTGSANGDDVDANMSASYDCATGTTLLIAEIYKQQSVNPQHLTFEDAVVDCLIAEGLVDSDYTAEDLNREGKASGERSYDMSDPKSNACFADPYPDVAK